MTFWLAKCEPCCWTKKWQFSFACYVRYATQILHNKLFSQQRMFLRAKFEMSERLEVIWNSIFYMLQVRKLKLKKSDLKKFIMEKNGEEIHFGEDPQLKHCKTLISWLKVSTLVSLTIFLESTMLCACNGSVLCGKYTHVNRTWLPIPKWLKIKK